MAAFDTMMHRAGLDINSMQVYRIDTVTHMNKVLLSIFMLLGSAAQADSLAQLHKTLDSFHQAAAQADMDSYFAYMTDDVVFLGTDGTERWQGQAFRDFVQPHFSAGRGWIYTSVERNIIVADDGRIAWFDESLRNEGLGLCRGSGVLVKSGREWKIAQYNLSVPIPNALVKTVVADIAAMDTAADVATIAPAVDSTSTASAGAASAIASDPVAAEPEVSEAKASGECKRKRFKTNSKAGC